MEKKNSFRGGNITPAFIERFKSSDFYNKIYLKHKNEIIIGIRDGYINLYYNCDSIAKITCNSQSLMVEISSYFTDDTSGKRTKVTSDYIVQHYEYIKKQSDKRKRFEKQAQARLFIDNNKNHASEWFCIDIEYARTDVCGRFDIIAISKKTPHQVALIELKYGNKALNGNSGIRNHIKDFYCFYKEKSFKNLRSEIVSIVQRLNEIGVELPYSLHNLQEKEIVSSPAFYIIVLDNNPELEKKSTPQQSISGYLFEDKRWGCKRKSSLIKKEGDYFSLIESDKSFPLTFLFSKSKLPNLGVSDILDEKFYDKEIISF